jgi:hypothetical protein
MLLLVVILKALAEVAILSMLAQGILHVLGARQDNNFVCRLFATVNAPLFKATRLITPRFVVDQHIWMVTFFLLGVLWMALVLAKVHYVLERTAPAT